MRTSGSLAAANAGAATARGDVLVFLNPDAEVEPGAVPMLVQALDAVPRAGIAGGGLVDDTGRWQPVPARFGVVAHLLLDTTLGRLGSRRARSVASSTGSTGRSWPSVASRSCSSADSTESTSSTARTWISAIAPRRRAGGRSTCPRRGRDMPRT
jgi:GT2 family glycosyltransferase